MHQTPWIGVPSKIREYAGFIYQITNLISGKMYVGRKYFFHTHTRSKGKLNAQWAGWVRTPLGIFETMKQAADAHGISSAGMAYRLQSAWPAMSDFIGPIKTEDGNIPKEWLQ